MVPCNANLNPEIVKIAASHITQKIGKGLRVLEE